MTVTSVTLDPPTFRLLPLSRKSEINIGELTASLDYLRRIYCPEVRGTRRLQSLKRPSPAHPEKHSNKPIHGADAGVNLEAALDILRADAFERAHSIRWLTALVSRADNWLPADSDCDPTVESAYGKIIDAAAALLALLAGTAAAGTLTRAFSFTQPHTPVSSFTIQLTDAPIDASALGAQTWGSACLLAELLVASPARFGLTVTIGKRLRVLELGSGTGLVSIAIARVLESQLEPGRENGDSDKCAEVVATDFHPVVLANLRRNVAANANKDIPVNVQHLDWSLCTDASPFNEPPLDERFDVMFGADIVYEAAHARWVRGCVEAFLRRPVEGSNAMHGGTRSCFHLVMPVRHTHTVENALVDEEFPPAVGCMGREDHSCKGTELCDCANQREHHACRKEFRAVTLAKEVIVCETDSGDEIEYVHYTIALQEVMIT